jgi:uncharacterized phage-associated protein
MKTVLEFDYKKAVQAINYFAKKEGGKIDKLKLIKLIYFADRYHIRKYGRPIINDTYLAMPLGAVGSSTKDIVDSSRFLAEEECSYAKGFFHTAGNSVTSIADIDSDVFSKSDIEALDFSYNVFGSYKAPYLVNICHKYPEWEKFKELFKSKETTRESMNYLDFFDNPKNEIDDFAMKEDELIAAKELFNEYYQIAKYWN